MKDQNLNGAVAEFAFFAEASRRGLSVSKPTLNHSPYDAVIDKGQKFFKIQIKSARISGKNRNSYLFSVQHSDGFGKSKCYSPKNVSHFAFYAADDDLWFIVPYKVVANLKRVRITSGKKNRLDKYLENWKLLTK